MINMQQGRIIKIISNQYTIQNEKEEIIAKPRGKMRQQQTPVVGDFVEYEKIEDSYRIHKVLPRTNRLLRPAIANVDQALIVTSLKDPDYSCHLLNRLIFLVGLAGVKPVICVTKLDLLEDPEEILADLEKYKKAGYDVVFSNPGSDDRELQEILNGKVSVLCGQSGAGKSSLLNRLNPDFELQTQAISKALGRGKHTTRYCQLHPVCDGLVADTPGFSSLDFTRLDTSHLDACILDFKPYIHTCRFKDCKHLNEPDCSIKEELNKGEINASIYEAKWLHFDVMDGHFVPNLTFGPDILKGFKKACPLFMDVHLMVEDPKTYAPIFIQNGADLVTFHTEALDNDLSRIQGLLDEIHNLGAKGGIVVKPNTAIEPFESVLKSCDLVLVMSVEPGFGGQKFMADMLKKVEWLKEKRQELNLSYRIEIDGGINQDTYKSALDAGCDTLVAGSYVFKNDITKTIEGMLA